MNAEEEGDIQEEEDTATMVEEVRKIKQEVTLVVGDTAEEEEDIKIYFRVNGGSSSSKVVRFFFKVLLVKTKCAECTSLAS